jgi:hypothetical protein
MNNDLVFIAADFNTTDGREALAVRVDELTTKRFLKTRRGQRYIAGAFFQQHPAKNFCAWCGDAETLIEAMLHAVEMATNLEGNGHARFELATLPADARAKFESAVARKRAELACALADRVVEEINSANRR